MGTTVRHLLTTISPEDLPSSLGPVGQYRELLDRHVQEITDLTRRHRGRTIAVFGSVARGDENDDSDIDFLVDFEPGSSLFDLLHLQDDLTALLGVPVDVVSTGGLKPRDDQIRHEAVPLQ